MEKINNFNQVTITNPCYNAEWSRQTFIELVKRLEGEFDCDIDYVDYSITFRYVYGVLKNVKIKKTLF